MINIILKTKKVYKLVTPKYDYDCIGYKEAKKTNCRVITLFFKNNKYKLKQKGISLYRQIQDLRLHGLLIDYCNTKKFDKGYTQTLSLSHLSYFCNYWGCDLCEMVSCDLEARDEILNSSV